MLPTLLLFGAGGHGRVVADAALRQAAWAQVQASDRDAARCHGELLPGVPLLDMARLDAVAATEGAPRPQVHIAIGHNAARARELVLWQSWPIVSVLHPAATVSPFAQLAPGCFVAAGAIVAPNARLGRACIVNHGAVVDHDVQVGDFCHIAPGATLGGAVVLGRQVLVGAGAVVLPGLSVADHVTIGAGAVVCASLSEPGTYVGVPARKVT